MVHDERAAFAAEQLTEANLADRLVAGTEVDRAFLEDVVLHDRTRRKLSALSGHPLAQLHERDLGFPQLVAGGDVVIGLLGQPGHLDGHGISLLR